MPARIPRRLTRQRADLAYQREELSKRLRDLNREIKALDYSIKVVAPAWTPPARVQRPYKSRDFRRGTITRACLRVLNELDEFDTTELCRRAAKVCNVKLESRKARQSFASAVAMVARRSERIGYLEELGRDRNSGAIRWRTRRDADGWLGPLKGNSAQS